MHRLTLKDYRRKKRGFQSIERLCRPSFFKENSLASKEVEKVTPAFISFIFCHPFIFSGVTFHKKF